MGIHNIVAFGDKNKNLIYEKGEPAGQMLTAEKVSAPAGGVAWNLDIVLSEQSHTKIDFPVGFQIQPKAHKKFHRTSPGAIAKMDDFLFSDEYATKGYETYPGIYTVIPGQYQNTITIEIDLAEDFIDSTGSIAWLYIRLK